jgi:hypothetical protein
VDHLHRAGVIRLPHLKRLQPRLPILLIRQLPRAIKKIATSFRHNHPFENGQLPKNLRNDLRPRTK